MATVPSASPQTSGKKTIKRKLDDSILKKARAALGLPLESHNDDEGKVEEPSLKLRKPRHNTAEGQIYIQNKEKRKRMEEETLSFKPSKVANSKTGKKDEKKKGKKKRKKKAKGSQSNDKVQSSEKDPEGEKRHGMEAISYLQLWSSNRDHWKFEKRKQTWLLKNCLSNNLIDDSRFETLLEYIGSVKGAARKTTLTEMQTLVTKFEMSKEGQNASDQPSDTAITESMYDRARQIVQMLIDD